MKLLKRTLCVLLAAAVILTAVFLAGRYGWKVCGFRACQGAEIASVDVSEHSVRIRGSYPGSFSKGFCGYYAEQRGGKLYVGFRFDAAFGFFETGNFNISIPIGATIDEVILKIRTGETSIWRAEVSAPS